MWAGTMYLLGLTIDEHFVILSFCWNSLLMNGDSSCLLAEFPSSIQRIQRIADKSFIEPSEGMGYRFSRSVNWLLSGPRIQTSSLHWIQFKAFAIISTFVLFASKLASSTVFGWFPVIERTTSSRTSTMLRSFLLAMRWLEDDELLERERERDCTIHFSIQYNLLVTGSGAESRNQITEARRMREFQEKLGPPEDTIVCIGDWTQRMHRRFKEPVKGKGFRSLFRKAGYKVRG